MRYRPIFQDFALQLQYWQWWGPGMDEEGIIRAARKMIELYDTDAEIVAVGRAETFAGCDKHEEALVWKSIAAAICKMWQKAQSPPTP